MRTVQNFYRRKSMSESMEDFARISGLNEAEAQTLRRIAADRAVMAKASEIAENFFIAPRKGWSPDMPEGPALSEAWFGAAWLSQESSHERYRALGIPEPVWLESMSDLKIWLRNERRNSGTIGLGPRSRLWQVEIYRGQVTRHGRLECNSEFFYSGAPLDDENGRNILNPGDPVINLHIPEDGPLDLDACGVSMRRIAEFFASWKPGYDWKGFLCQSWLLDRQLRPMLPADSNILKFQDLGRRYRMHETEDTIFRIFGYADPQSLPAPNTFQRGAAEFIRRGGKFIEEGMFIPRRTVEAADFRLREMV